MIWRIFSAFAISALSQTAAFALSNTPIQTVEIAPLFYQRFACTEHVDGELTDLGDALLKFDCSTLPSSSGEYRGHFQSLQGDKNKTMSSWVRRLSSSGAYYADHSPLQATENRARVDSGENTENQNLLRRNR